LNIRLLKSTKGNEDTLNLQITMKLAPKDVKKRIFLGDTFTYQILFLKGARNLGTKIVLCVSIQIAETCHKTRQK
jgi:hypothetical protein